LPTTVVAGATSAITTAPAPTTASSPITSAREVRARRHVRRGPQAAVVVDRRSGVDDRAVAHHHPGVEHRPRHHRDAFPEHGRRRDHRAGVHRRREDEALRPRRRQQPLAQAVVPQGDDRVPHAAGVDLGERAVVAEAGNLPPARSGRQPGVGEADHRPAGGEQDLDHHPRVAATPDDHHPRLAHCA
jgi:hypothetical protein